VCVCVCVCVCMHTCVSEFFFTFHKKFHTEDASHNFALYTGQITQKFELLISIIPLYI
jgi:hypothetical protein